MLPVIHSTDDGNDVHPSKITPPPIQGSPQVDPVMIEDDSVTIYHNVSHTSYYTSEHLEDTLTLLDHDRSEINTVYHNGEESPDRNGVTSLNGDCDRIKDQIPLEIIVNVESTESVENLSKSDEV